MEGLFPRPLEKLRPIVSGLNYFSINYKKIYVIKIISISNLIIVHDA